MFSGLPLVKGDSEGFLLWAYELDPEDIKRNYLRLINSLALFSQHPDSCFCILARNQALTLEYGAGPAGVVKRGGAQILHPSRFSRSGPRRMKNDSEKGF
jgi:hypothetical protein